MIPLRVNIMPLTVSTPSAMFQLNLLSVVLKSIKARLFPVLPLD